MQITDLLSDIITQALIKLELPAPTTIHLEHPADTTHGDYASNVAMTVMGQLKTQPELAAKLKAQGITNPRDLATALIEHISQLGKVGQKNSALEKVEVAGPGFINFTLSEHFLVEELVVISTPENKLLPQIGTGQQIVVEFSSPNIAKPFTIGHLRSTIIGASIAAMYEALGYHVYRDNHVGDWGTQFGKQIYALKNLGAGSLEKNIAAIESSPSPVKELVALYIEFHTQAESKPELEEEGRKWFKKLEDGDVEARQLWQKCIDWSFKEFDKLYQRLGVSFTENNGRGYGESYFEDKMDVVLTELTEKGLIKDSEGAKLVFFPGEQYPPLMVVKNDGATLYATRDLATDRFRLAHYGADIKIINEVGAEQATYFRQLYETEYLAGWFKPGQRVHVKHGLYRFKDKKMSTRKGNVIWLEEVLDEVGKRAREFARAATKEENQDGINEFDAQAQADQVGLGALKWNDLKRSSHLDVTFDWDEILTLKGNSGPYLQYTFVRASSVLQKSSTKIDYQIVRSILKQSDLAVSQYEKELLRNLYQYSDVVELAARECAPHHLCTYLYALAQCFNAFYTQHTILGSELSDEQRHFRLALTTATARILEQGLQILGISALKKM